MMNDEQNLKKMLAKVHKQKHPKNVGKPQTQAQKCMREYKTY